jgi:hypothetical protein
LPLREENGSIDANNGISIYPNPATEEIVITLDLAINGTIELAVTDMTGRLISATEISSAGGEIILEDISNLPSGMYFLVVRTEDEIIGSEKLFIQ